MAANKTKKRTIKPNEKRGEKEYKTFNGKEYRILRSQPSNKINEYDSLQEAKKSGQFYRNYNLDVIVQPSRNNIKKSNLRPKWVLYTKKSSKRK